MPSETHLPLSRGLFLALDGLDGSGKSTQCKLLAEWLRGRGYTVTQCTDPGGTPLGTQLRRLVLDQQQAMSLTCEMFLFMASRAQLVADVVRPALERKEVVVSDRFLLANVVYQGYAGGLDPRQLWEIGRLSTGGLEPALTIVLDLPVERALARKQGPADRMENRAVEFHQRVRQGFLEEARRCPERIRIIAADQPVETIHQRIVEEAERVLATHPGS